MSDQPISRASILKRLANRTALIYALLIFTYGFGRYVIQDRFWIVSLFNTFALFLFFPLPLLILFALIARSRRAAIYLLPIIMWSALWLGPRFLPKNIQRLSTTSSTFRVMTNNVSHFNIAPERVSDVALDQMPDIIFLQEVQLADQESALNPLDQNYPYQTRQNDQMRTTMYNAVNITYSRFPFVISEQIDPHIPEMPLIYRNVIEHEGQRIALYNIHLMSPGGSGRFPNLKTNYFVRYALNFDGTTRNKQVEALLAYLATEPYPYIAAGDFNTSDFSMTYVHLADQLRDSFSEATIGLGSNWPAARALGLPALIPPFIRIDYIWHSAGLQAIQAWKGEFVGSDHLPMFADLVLAATP